MEGEKNMNTKAEPLTDSKCAVLATLQGVVSFDDSTRILPSERKTTRARCVPYAHRV